MDGAALVAGRPVRRDCSYSHSMPTMTIYLDQRLYERVKASRVDRSKVCQEALRKALAEAERINRRHRVAVANAAVQRGRRSQR